eukprot:3899258-Pleurochrysis_carterae.AAC.1
MTSQRARAEATVFLTRRCSLTLDVCFTPGSTGPLSCHPRDDRGRMFFTRSHRCSRDSTMVVLYTAPWSTCLKLAAVFLSIVNWHCRNLCEWKFARLLYPDLTLLGWGLQASDWLSFT